MFCSRCGAPAPEGAAFCASCGASVGAAPPAVGDSAGSSGQTPPPVNPPKSKLVAALLGIFVGAFGVHRFYLGYNSIAVAQLILGVLGLVTCGITTLAAAIWGLIEGILILTGNINQDAWGRPLVDG